MKTITTILTIFCGLAIITLIYGILNNWSIPTETILTWVGACVFCPIMVHKIY